MGKVKNIIRWILIGIICLNLISSLIQTILTFTIDPLGSSGYFTGVFIVSMFFIWAINHFLKEVPAYECDACKKKFITLKEGKAHKCKNKI